MKRTLHGMLALVAVFLLHAPSAFGAGRPRHAERRGQGLRRRRRAGRHGHRDQPRDQRRVAPADDARPAAIRSVNLIPGRYQVDVELSGFKKSSQVVDARGRPARAARRRARGRRVRRDGHRRGIAAAAQHQRRDARRGHSADRRWRTCRWRSATGTTCWRSCPACRAIATPSRAAARRSAAPAASTSTAPARCRTTSCSTAWTTTASPRTSRS